MKEVTKQHHTDHAGTKSDFSCGMTKGQKLDPQEAPKCEACSLIADKKRIV
jgi:hypothetical protein